MKRGGNASAVSECRVGGREADYGLIVAISALCSGNLWRLISLDSRMFGLQRLEETPFIYHPQSYLGRSLIRQASSMTLRPCDITVVLGYVKGTHYIAMTMIGCLVEAGLKSTNNISLGNRKEHRNYKHEPFPD